MNNMRRTCLFLLPLVWLGISARSQTGAKFREPLDTAKMVFETKLENSDLLKGLGNLNIIDFYQDTLFLVNNGTSLVKVSLADGHVQGDPVTDSLIGAQRKQGLRPTLLSVYGGFYLIGFGNELYRREYPDQAKLLFLGDAKIIWAERTVLGVLLADRDSIKMISNDGKQLAAMPFTAYGSDLGFIKEREGICYQKSPADSIYVYCEAQALALACYKYPPLANMKIKDPYIAYSSRDEMIVYDYPKRDVAYYVKKKGDKNRLLKTIDLSILNYAPTKEELAKEKGRPNLKAFCSGGKCYLIALAGDSLKICAFELN